MLAGLEVTNFQKRIHDMTLTGITGNTQRTLDTLITSDINTGVDKALTNPWVISVNIERSRSLAFPDPSS